MLFLKGRRGFYHPKVELSLRVRMFEGALTARVLSNRGSGSDPNNCGPAKLWQKIIETSMQVCLFDLSS